MKIAVLIPHLIFGFCLYATPIRFTIDATGTGTLNGIPFTNQPIQFVIGADTDSQQTVLVPPPAFIEKPESLAITIGGIGTVYVTDSEYLGYVFDNPRISAFGWGSIGGDKSDFTAPAFASYDLLTSVGPITPASADIGDWRIPLKTSNGPMVLTSYTGTQTIVASLSTIPEPTPFFLLGFGLAVICSARFIIGKRFSRPASSDTSRSSPTRKGPRFIPAGVSTDC